jgi:hypothetical protein
MQSNTAKEYPDEHARSNPLEQYEVRLFGLHNTNNVKIFSQHRSVLAIQLAKDQVFGYQSVSA